MRDRPFLLFAAVAEYALNDFEHLDHRLRGHLFRLAAEVKAELVEDFGQLGLQVGAEKFSRWIGRFGFGRPTGVQFPAEEQGLVPSLEEYSGSTMGNLPIGQGLGVTPMQMIAGYAAIANGGVATTSGYGQWGGIRGNVLLVFSVDGK